MLSSPCTVVTVRPFSQTLLSLDAALQVNMLSMFHWLLQHIKQDRKDSLRRSCHRPGTLPPSQEHCLLQLSWRAALLEVPAVPPDCRTPFSKALDKAILVDSPLLKRFFVHAGNL